MYSVLMSVYFKEKPEYLYESMESIWNQSVKTDDFVLVCDGPLTKELDEIINDMKKKHPELHVIRLKKNGGLGNALNIGIKHCKNELVARMDSDDISRIYRCEKQLAIFEQFPDISVVSGTVEEFSTEVKSIEAKRVLPEKNEEIVKFAKSRNPFNHPCVMYRKSDIERVGGYKDFYLLEDYYLWIRILKNGLKGYNIEEPLLYMRAGADMYKRRSGLKYAKSQRRLFRYMRDIGFISRGECLKSMLVRTTASIMPNKLRKKMYEMRMRKK